MIITVGDTKGGSGKTTIVTNLAVSLARQGRDIIILDIDHQRTASKWLGRRLKNEVSTPRIVGTQQLDRDAMRDTIQDLAGRYQDVIVDTAGQDSAALRWAIACTQLLVIPLRPAQFDLEVILEMADLIDKIRPGNPDLTARVLLSQAPSNQLIRETSEAKEALAEIPGIELMDSVIRERIAYRHAAAEGKSVVEMKDSRARGEVEVLAREVLDIHTPTHTLHTHTAG